MPIEIGDEVERRIVENRFHHGGRHGGDCSLQICRNVATQSKSGARCSNDLQCRSICARTSELGGYHSEKASIANRRMSGFPLNMSHRGIHRFEQFLSGVEWCAQLLNESAPQHIGPNCLKHVCRIHAQLSFGMSAFAFRFGKEAPLRPLNAMARSDTSALIPCFEIPDAGLYSVDILFPIMIVLAGSACFNDHCSASRPTKAFFIQFRHSNSSHLATSSHP